jgi:hypothetical protein
MAEDNIDSGSSASEDSPKQTLEWVQAATGPVLEVYSNYTHTSWSLYDMRVMFGQIIPELDDSMKFIVEERAAVTVAWPQLSN